MNKTNSIVSLSKFAKLAKISRQGLYGKIDSGEVVRCDGGIDIEDSGNKSFLQSRAKKIEEKENGSSDGNSAKFMEIKIKREEVDLEMAEVKLLKVKEEIISSKLVLGITAKLPQVLANTAKDILKDILSEQVDAGEISITTKRVYTEQGIERINMRFQETVSETMESLKQEIADYSAKNGI